MDKPESPAPAHSADSMRTRLLAKVTRMRGPIAAIAAAGAVLSGLVGYWNAYRSVREGVAPAVATKGFATAAISPSNSFAVLPFNARSTDPAELQWAKTLTVELTLSLQRGMPDWSVASHSLAATHDGKNIDARAVARELNVRYVVEGLGGRAGSQGVVKVSLTDTSTGTQLWSDGLEFESPGSATSSQEFIARLTNQVRRALYDAQFRGVLEKPVSASNAAELAVRADRMQDLGNPSVSVLAEARTLYDKALSLNPHLTAALLGKALTIGAALELDPLTDRTRLLREYDDASARLVAVAEREARAWNIRADALETQWQWDAALEANTRAQAIDPTRTNTLGQRADILIAMGRPGEARALVDQALFLESTNSGAGTQSYLLVNRCRASLALGQIDEAIKACAKSTSLRDNWWAHAHLVAAYALRGDDVKADTEKVKLLSMRKSFSVAEYKARQISEVPAYVQQIESHFFAGLRKAGIPEGQPLVSSGGSRGVQK